MKRSDEILNDILKKYKVSLEEFKNILDKDLVIKDKIKHCMDSIDTLVSNIDKMKLVICSSKEYIDNTPKEYIAINNKLKELIDSMRDDITKNEKELKNQLLLLCRYIIHLEEHSKILLDNEFIINKFISNEFFQNNFETLDEIEMHYKNLEVKTCWGKVLIGIDKVRNITLIFSRLSKIYPNIKIREIGEAQFNSENDKIDPAGQYIPKDMKILIYSNSLQKNYEATIVHEFGHAIGHQYDINNDKHINFLYSNLTKEEVTSKISDYATENVHEFIAECFVKSFCYDDNAIVNKVKNRIDEMVKEKDNS